MSDGISTLLSAANLKKWSTAFLLVKITAVWLRIFIFCFLNSLISTGSIWMNWRKSIQWLQFEDKLGRERKKYVQRKNFALKKTTYQLIDRKKMKFKKKSQYKQRKSKKMNKRFKMHQFLVYSQLKMLRKKLNKKD